MSPRKGANKSLPPKHKPMAEKHRRELSKPSRNTSDFQERSVLLRNLRSVAGELSLSMSETSTECDDRESTRESIRMDEMQSKPVEIPPTDRSVLLALGLPLALGSGRAPADRAPRGSSRPTGDACYEPADEPKAHSWRARPHEGSHGDVAAALLSPSGCEAFSPDHGTEERVDETAGGSGVPAVAVAAAAAEEEEERGGREERPATEGLPPAGDALVRAVIFRGRVGLREFDSPEAAAAEEPRAQPRASPSATERRPHTAVPSGAARVSASRRMETEPPRPMVRGRGFRGALPPLLSSRFGDPTTAERFDRPMTAPAPGQSRQGRPSHVRLDPCARLFRIVEDMGKHWPLLQVTADASAHPSMAGCVPLAWGKAHPALRVPMLSSLQCSPGFLTFS
uniref:Uncharacterized protein n=1 Tax=Tetraselmis sp. GSL018 TaxID=582737 RepID=A0A061RGI2_9CHLO